MNKAQQELQEYLEEKQIILGEYDVMPGDDWGYAILELNKDEFLKLKQLINAYVMEDRKKTREGISKLLKEKDPEHTWSHIVDYFFEEYNKTIKPIE